MLLDEADEHRLALCWMKSSPTRICVPVCVQRVSELPKAIKRAAAVADIIELRLDYFSKTELAQEGSEIWSLLTSRTHPIILTLRPAEFGGARAISAEDRLDFRQNYPWISEKREPAVFCDLEFDLALLLQRRQEEGNDVVGWGICDWTGTVCSYHNFVGVPAGLEKIYERMAATPARILKVAVQANDATDCLSIFHLLERAREGREIIAVAMGQAGIMTRILGPSRGSFLTYGSLDDESATAPGQVTARDLREVYRIDRIDRRTQIFGLMGRPVGHSISPHIHNAALRAAGLNAVYIPFEVGDAGQFLRRMVRPGSRELDWNLRGLSVTAPHKSAVIRSLDWIEPAAHKIGAVNTIVLQESELRGYNTDASGFISPLRNKFGSLKNARCAIIGAGGGARAALWALRKEEAQVELFVRDVARAKSTAEQFDVDSHVLASADLAGFDIVINATPMGMRGQQQDETPATAEQLRNVRLAYDLVYNPLETRFLREARAAGCETLGGIEMLLAQAAEQFKLWTGGEPEVELMRAAALGALKK